MFHNAPLFPNAGGSITSTSTPNTIDKKIQKNIIKTSSRTNYLNNETNERIDKDAFERFQIT